MRKKLISVFLLAGAFSYANVAAADSMALSDGYVLCGAYSGKFTVLIDQHGDAAYRWNHTNLPDSLNGYVVYLLQNGNLLRSSQVNQRTDTIPPGSGPIQGIVEEIDPNGAVIWQYRLANDTFLLHHDMKPLSNGNFIAVAFEAKTIADAKKVGVDTALFPRTNPKILLSERIIEVNPRAEKGEEIVWDWHLWDHITPKNQAAEHPELFNGSAGKPSGNQWVHLNGITICEERDLIVFTSRLFSELFIIDHGTTIQEAAGHIGGKRGKGGDFLYRWGNPTNYDTTATQRINVLHCPTWIPDEYPGGGHILFFHNNMSPTMSSEGLSEVVEIALPLDAEGNFIKSPGVPFGPEEPAWLYAPSDSFYSMAMSSAFRLANGNTLIHEAFPSAGRGGILREVTVDQKLLWKFTMQFGDTGGTRRSSFMPAKVMYYPSNYAGITNLFIKIGKLGSRLPNNRDGVHPRLHFNHANGRLFVDRAAGSEIRLFTLQGKPVAQFRVETERCSFKAGSLPRGLYLVKISPNGRVVTTGAILIR
ncbi:MAG: aryl-sulfate sulfotransferase [Chitinispirillaceae bacterium]|nr:aryl-sulfate sulfotransferase [Chitinispirillaceae bacterium]